MKKRYQAVLCLLLSALLLASCAPPLQGDGPAQTTAAEGPAPSDPQTQDPVGSSLGAPSPVLTDGKNDDAYTADYVTAADASPDMEIRIAAPRGYTAEKVLSGIKFSNFSVPAFTDPALRDTLVEPDYLEVKKDGDVFSVTCHDGFNAGETYQLELTDDALRYEGEDALTRLYNVTAAAEDAYNMRLRDDVACLPVRSLNRTEAERVMQLDGLFRAAPDSGALRLNNGGGDFTYDAGAFVTGETVAVYEGEAPDARTAADADKSVAYIRITGVTPLGGGRCKYAYEGAKQEDVLFTPDVIPLNQACAAPVGGEGSVTVPTETLVFGPDGEYAPMGLDESTTVDEGDFIAFYEGSVTDGSVTAYAKITSVTYAEGGDADGTTLEYTVVTLDELLDSVDYYRHTTMTEEQVLEAFDEKKVVAGVKQDLNANGYTVKSSYELARLALETPEAGEAFGDVPLEDMTFYYGENSASALTGKQFLAIAEGKVPNGAEIKGDADVMISPNIVHFAGKTGYGMGVRVEAFAKFVVTVTADDARVSLRVTPTFFFETEVCFGFTADATSIWDWWGIFPYLYDYNITGSTTAGVYTGAGFTANATLIRNDKPETAAGIPWPDEVDKTPGAEKVMGVMDFVRSSAEKHDRIFPAQDTGGGTLAQKYASFIKGANKAWVDLIAENIFDWNGAVDPFHVFAFRLKADWIVAAQLNAAVGVGVNYERSVRQTFSFMLFHKSNETNQTEETDPSVFRLDAYLFGALGLRAGIRLTVGVGLFDCRLDSVGFEGEIGIYCRFWGLFYAGIEIADAGRPTSSVTSYYQGAYLFELGFFYRVCFVAQAGDGAISYRKELVNKEVPLSYSGTPYATSDFNYTQGDISFAAEFTKDRRTAVIPADVFVMQAMSMKDGAVSAVDYGAEPADKVFDITFDDPDFKYEYDYNGRRHLIRRTSGTGGEKTLTMTVRFKETGSQTISYDLVRTFRIPWVDGMATMKFMNYDGSVFFAVNKVKDAPLTAEDLPQTDPIRPCHTFKCWLRADGTPLEAMPAVMPAQETVFTPDWTRNEAPFNVEYYIPRYFINNETVYELDVTDRVEGLLYEGEKVEDALELLTENGLLRTLDNYAGEGETYQGLRADRFRSVISCDHMRADGSTTFRIFLERIPYTVTFHNGYGDKTEDTFYYGRTVSFPALTRPGYTFRGWLDKNGDPVTEEVRCYEDMAFTAQWEKDPPTLTVTVQKREKTWGFNYQWRTTQQLVLTFDSYETTVRALLERITAPEGTSYSDVYNARGLDDVITIAEDGSAAVILRFT